jgi:hypothetical protein
VIYAEAVRQHSRGSPAARSARSYCSRQRSFKGTSERLLLWSHERRTGRLQAGFMATLLYRDRPGGVYFQDNVGSKLNYCLSRSVAPFPGGMPAPMGGRPTAALVWPDRHCARKEPGLKSRSLIPFLTRWKPRKLKPGVQRMFVARIYAPPERNSPRPVRRGRGGDSGRPARRRELSRRPRICGWR